MSGVSRLAASVRLESTGLSPFDSITRKENGMSVTKVIELSASSAESIEGAVREGLARAG